MLPSDLIDDALENRSDTLADPPQLDLNLGPRFRHDQLPLPVVQLKRRGIASRSGFVGNCERKKTGQKIRGHVLAADNDRANGLLHGANHPVQKMYCITEPRYPNMPRAKGYRLPQKWPRARLA